jgi:hypothetical protein
MGLKMPAAERRALLAVNTVFEPCSAPHAKVYDAVIVDASAQGRNMMAPLGEALAVSMASIGTAFFNAVFRGHPAARRLVVCYDNAGLLPAIREEILHVNRYGPRLDRAPAMDAEHVFLEGRVWAIADRRKPASPAEVEASTIDWLAASLDSMLASGAGKRKVMLLHCEAVKRAAELAFEAGTLHCETTVVLVPPVGDVHHVVTQGAVRTEPRLTQYGEADMLIVAHAAVALAESAAVLIRTIDTDAVVQAYFFAMGQCRGRTLDLHIATVHRDAGGLISAKRKPGFSRHREIVDIAALVDRVSPASMALVLVYGGDYIAGVCIRGLGLPKKALAALIQSGSDDWLAIGARSLTIDWGRFFGCLATAAKAPKKPLNAAVLNTEMQRFAYCIAYFCGFQADAGGPAVDPATIVSDTMGYADLAGVETRIYE